MIYIISDPAYTMHNTGIWHPEQPARTVVIDRALTEAHFNIPIHTLHSRLATENEVLLCHTYPYFQLVRREVEALSGSSKTALLSTGDTSISSHSFEIALLAVGGVLKAIDQVMNVPGSKVFCVIRPPGHHACPSSGMGFCLFNNVAIGARYAQKQYGAHKVLIADWDVHHGNGTQEVFYRDANVFYFSTHEKGLYPYTGSLEEIGEGTGRGTTLNCPILPGSLSRLEVIRAFETQLREKMKIFQPNLVLVSAGFDAHEADPLGHFNLTNQDFSTLTRILKEIADEYAEGRFVSVLEGGYNLQALASAALAHVKALI